MTTKTYIPVTMTYDELYHITQSQDFKQLWLDKDCLYATVDVYEDILSVTIPGGFGFTRIVEFQWDATGREITTYDCVIEDDDVTYSSADDENLDEEQLAKCMEETKKDKEPRALVRVNPPEPSIDFKYMRNYLKEKAR